MASPAVNEEEEEEAEDEADGDESDEEEVEEATFWMALRMSAIN